MVVACHAFINSSILAFHVGKRNKAALSEALMAKLPEELKKNHFYTDKFSVYYAVIPWTPHSAVVKEFGKTSYIERFNCTIKQRCSRLVRKALSFSKKIESHIVRSKCSFVIII
jgi:insertion element IS1 protein InsB